MLGLIGTRSLLRNFYDARSLRLARLFSIQASRSNDAWSVPIIDLLARLRLRNAGFIG
ncbi:hypothetical protein NKH93_22860 [Mesorhizobium sp. M0954]|uniref:hypothetical protein n=1 Tax=Mesorhizobium sp. M0954 TaxID=2957032 RepID=UPI00333646CB